MSKRDKQLVQAGIDISGSAPGGDQMTLMHTIMCQVELPRSQVDGLEFERISGAVGLHVRAGKLWDGKQFLDAPTEAIITNPGTSDWLKHTLQSALSRDCMDAARDAETLAEILGQRANAQLATLASGGQT